MKDLLIITPVKDAVETASRSISKIVKSKGNFDYIVYDDYSSFETQKVLRKLGGFQLIHIEDHIKKPSPNYRFTLIDARKRALEKEAGLLIVESDVFVKEDSIQKLHEFANRQSKCGMVAAITVDENDRVNFPYLHIKDNSEEAVNTTHRLSFCCTLLTPELLKALDFEQLSDKKHWFDVQISKDSRILGFNNYVMRNVRVQHLPHSSRPWKNLKYSNPVKYYLRKWFLGKDKI